MFLSIFHVGPTEMKNKIQKILIKIINHSMIDRYNQN